MALTFREYGVTMILAIVGLAMIVNFTGGVVNVYGGNAESSTLQEIKNQTESTNPSVANLRNRTESVNVDEGAFLSPQGYNIVSDLLSGVTGLPKIFETAIAELGLPVEVILLASIPVIALIFEALTLLFGIRT